MYTIRTDQELVPLGPEDQSKAAPYAVAASAGTRAIALTILTVTKKIAKKVSEKNFKKKGAK